MNWEQYARKRAKHYGFDPDVFVRQINQESGFRPHVTSPAGARGIAQIMPTTAQGWGVNPDNPRQALDAAAKHMAEYARQYGVRGALIAYNAGPGAVGRGNLPAETQNYIRNILNGSNPKLSGVGRVPPRGPSATSTGVTPDPLSVLNNYIKNTQGLFQDQPQQGSSILDTLETLKRITGQGQPSVSPAVSPSRTSSVSLPSGPGGKVIVGPTANRAGVGLQKPLMSFLSTLAGHAGTINIGTGTNHNRMTVDGNVSDHWDGNAADLPMPVDSQQGDLMAAHAIALAGHIPFQKALAMARRGGLFNFQTKAGRVQVIWKTNIGGNHHNHVHIGLNPSR